MQKLELELKAKIREINKAQRFFVKEKKLGNEYWKLEKEKVLLKRELKKLKEKNRKTTLTQSDVDELKKPKLIEKLDKYFGDFIKLRDTNSQGFGICITCKKTIQYLYINDEGEIKKRGGVANNCHWISRSYYSHRRDEKNCNLGCVHCNKWNQGFHNSRYGEIMVQRYGQERVDEQMRNRNKTLPTVEELKELIEIYKNKVKKLKAKKTL